MTFDRDRYSTYYLMITRIHRELMYKKHSFIPGTNIRESTEQVIKELEELKSLIAKKINV